MEAIILAGGKAERLGDAAGGRPKALVEVAGRPLAAYQVGRLAQAGVTRVIFACAAGQGPLFVSELEGLGPEIVAAEEPEPEETGPEAGPSNEKLPEGKRPPRLFIALWP